MARKHATMTHTLEVYTDKMTKSGGFEWALESFAWDNNIAWVRELGAKHTYWRIIRTSDNVVIAQSKVQPEVVAEQETMINDVVKVMAVITEMIVKGLDDAAIMAAFQAEFNTTENLPMIAGLTVRIRETLTPEQVITSEPVNDALWLEMTVSLPEGAIVKTISDRKLRITRFCTATKNNPSDCHAFVHARDDKADWMDNFALCSYRHITKVVSLPKAG